MKDLEFSLVMRLRDQASRLVQRGMRDMRGETQRTDRSLGQLGRTMQAYERSATTAERQSRGLISTMRRMAAERGPVAMVNTLRNVVSYGGRAMRTLERMRDVAAGVAAGAYVVGRPLGRQMDYSMRLAQMANTAFADRNTVGRVAGKRELDAAIVRAVRYGGGTRDSAASSLDTLIASGAMSPSVAMAQLPGLMRSSTASGADPNELAQIGIRGMQTFGIKPNEIGRAIDMAITAGQAGGFELRDMAKWLPQQMAAGRLSGLSGIGGLAKILAANQASAITAGSKDEAGNNLVNLLAKINSRETAMDAKKYGIDLPGTLAAARGKGMDSLDAFVALARKLADANPDFVKLKAQLGSAPAGDRAALLASQADILQGSALGGLVQDRQAMMALVALMNNGGYMADVQRQVLAGGGATERNFAVIAEEAGYKTQQMLNESAIASNTAFEKLAPAVGDAAEKVAAYAQEYPGLTSALSAATTGLTALAVASGASGLSSMLRGGAGKGVGSVLGNAGKALPKGPLRGPLGELRNVGKIGTAARLGTGGSLALAAGPMAAIYGASEWAGDTSHDQERVGFLKGLSDSLGSLMPDFTGGARARYEAARNQLTVKVDVEVKNGNIVASVREAEARDASRK